jgi:hypothetical protein
MRRLVGTIAAVAATAMLAAGCADPDNRPATKAGPETTTSTAAQKATLAVTTKQRVGPDGMMYTEGALPQVTLVAEDGHRIKGKSDQKGTFTFGDLLPGTYVVSAALRPCDGNCGYLDPPTDACKTSLHIDRDTTAAARWVIGHPCHLTT